MRNELFRKGLVFTVIVLFVGASVIPSISGVIETDCKETNGEKGTAVIENPISMDSIREIEENVPSFDGDITVVSIQPPAQCVEKGKWFNVGIYVEPSEPITDVGIDIIYFDPTLIQVIHVRAVWDLFEWDPVPGDPPGFNPGIIDNINGSISYIIGGEGVASDPGYFCNITFIAQQKPGTSPLDIQNVFIWNINHDLLPSTVIDGEVTVRYSCWPPIPELNGTMGENGWYVSDVLITFVGDCFYVEYNLNHGDWQIYTEPILVSGDGMYTLCWYAVDSQGNISEGCIDFKIDQTAPTIELTVEKIGFRKWLITADVYDETSGVNRVEFYLDGELLGTVTTAPFEFEWEWSGTGGHTAQAIVYDNAGNYATSDPVPVSRSQSRSSNPQTPLFFQILGRLLNTR